MPREAVTFGFQTTRAHDPFPPIGSSSPTKRSALSWQAKSFSAVASESQRFSATAGSEHRNSVRRNPGRIAGGHASGTGFVPSPMTDPISFLP